MFDGNDRETFHSIQILKDVASRGDKPIIFWIGAGASFWCGYPRWKELAEKLHSEFIKYEHVYNKEHAAILLDEEIFPKYFSYCFSISKARYYKELVGNLSPKEMTPVYGRFVSVLSDIEPCSIITTNVDQCLEGHLNGFSLLERSDLERGVQLIQSRQSFIVKLHGSISSVKSMVFTEEDYLSLRNDDRYIEILSQLISSSIVIFLGYEVSDNYVINLLKESVDLKEIFGDGPHFVVTSSVNNVLPESVHSIRYIPEPHTDHRSSIQVVEIVRSVKKSVSTPSPIREGQNNQDFKSAYFISDFMPPGEWQSSQTINAINDSGREIQATVGTGFVDTELPYKVSTALHDLSVGLVCFECVYFPSSSLGKVHQLLGSDRFWNLIDAKAIRFIHCENEPAIIFPTTDSVTNGDVGMISLVGGEGLGPISVENMIRRHLKPIPGKESLAESQFHKLEEIIEVIEVEKSALVPTLTRGTLLQPEMRKMLGCSDAILPTCIPRWMVFPFLRLAHIVMNGVVCEALRIPALKLHYGGKDVAGIAFAAVCAKNQADDIASYVTTGHYLNDIGAAVTHDPSILDAIMKFRETQAAESLHRDILCGLETNNGGEVVAAIDAGLRSVVSVRVIEDAREELEKLMLVGPGVKSIPAVWANSKYGDKAMALWRRRSTTILTEYCKTNHVGPYDLCPCGSGEKLKFCCENALTA